MSALIIGVNIFRIKGVYPKWLAEKHSKEHKAIVVFELDGANDVSLNVDPNSIEGILKQFYQPLGRHFYLKNEAEVYSFIFPAAKEVNGNAVAYCTIKEKYYNPLTGEEMSV